MRILVLGASGMIGHRLFWELAHLGHDVYGSVRSPGEKFNQFVTKFNNKIFKSIDARQFSTVSSLLEKIKPDLIINAIGIVKQNKNANDWEQCIELNSLFPQRLALECAQRKIRMIQLSTDCVFSGEKGNYTEQDWPDATDCYGKSKILGEVVGNPFVLTVRTSTVGNEIENRKGLLEWFLNSTGEVKGFKGALYSGFTTKELAKVFHEHVFPQQNLSGLYHISAPVINKFELLQIFKKHFKKEINIVQDDSLKVKRDLCDNKFRKVTKFVKPDWDKMVEELARDYRGIYV